MTLARRCGLAAVALHLPERLGQEESTARQRLKEFYQGAPANGGPPRKGEHGRCL
jgi:hypothetical protein